MKRNYEVWRWQSKGDAHSTRGWHLVGTYGTRESADAEAKQWLKAEVVEA